MWITCRRGNLKSTMGRVVRKYNVKFLSEGRSKSDCTFFVELWRSIVSEVCVSCAQEICTQSSECKVCVTVSDGRYKSHCTVWSWVTYNGECVSIALKSSVRKVLNVKFVSRGQFALAEKISRGCSTILNFQRHFLFVTQLISQQTNFWYRRDKTTRSFDLVSNDFSIKINFTAFDVVWLFHISQLPCFRGITTASYHVIIWYWVFFFPGCWFTYCSAFFHLITNFHIVGLWISSHYKSPLVNKQQEWMKCMIVNPWTFITHVITQLSRTFNEINWLRYTPLGILP